MFIYTHTLSCDQPSDGRHTDPGHFYRFVSCNENIDAEFIGTFPRVPKIIISYLVALIKILHQWAEEDQQPVAPVKPQIDCGVEKKT